MSNVRVQQSKGCKWVVGKELKSVNTHTHTNTHMSTLCVAEREGLRSLVRGRYLVALLSRLQLQLFPQSQNSSTLRSLAHTTAHENTIAHQSRPRAKLRLRMDVGAALARPAIVLDTRYGAVRIPHQSLPVWDRLELQLVNHSWAGIIF